MAVAGNPPVNNTGHMRYPGKQGNSTQNHPPLAGMHQRLADRVLSAGTLAISTNPLHGFFAFSLREPKSGQVRKLPGHDFWVALHTPLDEANTACAKRTISVEHEN